MQNITLDGYTTYTDLYSVLGLPTTTPITLTHRGTQTFNLVYSATQPSNTLAGFPVSPLSTIKIPGYPDKTVWIRGGVGVCIVQKSDEAILPSTTVEFPNDLYSSDQPGYRRVGVELGETSFYEGRQFRTFKEFNIPQGSSYLVKAQVPLDIILHSLWLNLDASGVRVSIYDGGAESITLGESLPVIPKNHMDEVIQPEYLAQTSIVAGFATHTGGLLLDVDRLVAGNQSVSRSTVGGEIADQRGVDSGTYYFLIENIAGTNATGVFKAWFEERK